MEHDCKFEDKIIEIHGDIKTLVAEFKAMNGSLRETKQQFNKHDDESVGFRRKVDIVWAAMHTMKWAILLLFGTGLVWKIIDLLIRL